MQLLAKSSHCWFICYHTPTLSLGKCQSTPSISFLALSSSTSPFSGYQYLVVMEQETVTSQVSKGSVFLQKQEVGSFATACEDNWTSNNVSAVTDIVLTQPGLGVTKTTITTITQTGGGWSTGLFDICEDKTTCLLGALLPCCLDLSLAHQYGECLCMPLLPGSTFALRVGIRERYKIRGSVCEDWTTVFCCYPLALCQMIREMKGRMKTQTYHVSTALECS